MTQLPCSRFRKLLRSVTGSTSVDTGTMRFRSAIAAASAAILSFCAPASAGLVGHYTFENNTNDSSAAGNNPSSGSVTSYAAGVNGQAAFFNGSTDKLILPIDISPGVKPVLTMGAWVKASTITDQRAILSADDNNPANYDRQIGLDPRSNNEPTGGGAGGTPTYSAFCGGSNSVLWGGQTVSTSEFTFVAVRYDGARVTMFVGDKVFSANDTTDDDATHHPQLWVGKNPFHDQHFHGYMDNVFVFDHALSNAEIKAIRTGGSAAIVAAGAVKSPFMWGYNANGALGDGTTTNRTTAVPVNAGALAGKNVTGIGTGSVSSVAITTEGKAYTWGTNSWASLGTGLANGYVAGSPAAIATGALAGKFITEVGSGGDHHVVLTSDGKIYGWGGNYYGQLGDGLGGTSGYPGYTTTAVATNMSGVLANKTVTAISVGDIHTMVLTSEGKVYGWGQSNHGQVGNGTNTNTINQPVAVDTTGVLAGKTVTAISAGGGHTLALTTEGKVYAWGFNSAGAIGDGSTTERLSPVAVDMTGALAGKTVVGIAAGIDHSVVLASDGKFYAWGIGSEGSIGDGSSTTRLTPVAVNMTGALAGKTVVSYNTGGYHTLVLANDGKLYSWGRGGSGQLGNGGSSNSNVPVAVTMTGALADKTIGMLIPDSNQSAALASNAPNTAPTISAGTEQLAYETVNPTRSGSNIVYSVNNATTLSSASFSRVKYRMETRVSGTVRYAETSFDAWSGLTVAGLRVPDVAGPFTVQRNVTNLTVDSNYPGVVNATAQTGRLELWASDYAPSAPNGVGGNSSTYDFDDTPSPGTYGSFQVHNLSAVPVQTVLAWNRHADTNPDIGFGNRPTGDPDWTFSTPGLGKTDWKLQISIVNPGVPASFSMIQDTVGNIVFSGTPFADDSASLTVTLAVADGTITGNAGTGIVVGGTATARTFTGSIANLNAYFTTAGKITYLGALGNTASRTLTITLSDGTLSASTTRPINFTGVPDIAVEQVGPLSDGVSSIAFGTLNPGVSGTAKTFTIRNSGTSNLTGIAVSKDGAASGDYAVNTTGMATTLAPAATTTFSVIFTPSATGTRSAALHIASNVSGAKNPFDIALSGTGNSAPVVTLNGAATITTEAGAAFSAPNATANDVEDGALVPVVTGSVNTAVPGSYTLTYTATDSGGRSDSKIRTVNVVDTTAPVVAAHANVTVEATGPGGATVTYAAGSASDFVGVTSLTYSQNSGTNFPLGNTTVTITARDAANNAGTNTFTVTVRDTTAPVVTVPANITLEATSGAGAVATFTTSATDTVSGARPTIASPASGSTFPLGTTTVNVASTDAAGNTGNASFTVTVRDTTAPAITVPADITAEATSASGAAVSFTVSANDLVDGAIAAIASPASGSTFPIGTTTVNVMSTDVAGNTGNRSFTVKVEDTTAPAITVPANIRTEATSAAGATVAFSVSASDIVDGAVSATATPSSGSVFAIGTTTVAVESTDATGNVGHSSFTITVEDTTAPAITVPANITAEATSAAGAVVNYVVTASDIVDGPVAAIASPASGSVFPLGTTTVNIISSDIAGNIRTASFTVTVQDTTGPTITVPANITVEATDATGTIVTFTVSAADTVDAASEATASPASGSLFPIGTTTVTVTSPDNAGNTGSRTFTVTVRDTTRPVVTVPANITVGSSVPTGSVVNFTVSANDHIDGAITATATPASGSTFAVGTTTVNVSATDAAGNTGTASFTVTVIAPEASVHALADAAVMTAGEAVVYPLANDTVPAGSTLTITSVTESSVIIDGRTLIVPAGYVGTFRYTISDGTTEDSADVVVTAGTSEPNVTSWTGLLFDNAGAIAGRARISQSTGVRIIQVQLGKTKGTARFNTVAPGTAVPEIKTYAGTVAVTMNANGLAEVTVSGGYTGTLRPSRRGTILATYNVAFDAVDTTITGGSFGTVRVKPSGVATVTMTLPDSRSFTSAAEVSDNGTINFYGMQSLARPGFLGGELVLADLTKTDITGEIEWKKPVQTSGLHRNGVSTILVANGCTFMGDHGIANGPAIVTCKAGNLASPVVIASNIVRGVVTAVPGQLVDWTIHPVTKALRFRFTDPASSRVILVNGAFFPKTRSAVGFFSGTTVGGKVELSAP